MKTICFAIILLITSLSITAQNTQTIRGHVTDKESQQPLPGATVFIPGTEPLLGATTDMDGYFKIPGVKVGRQNVTVSYVGYKTVTLSNLIINVAQEMVLEIELEENVIIQEAVEIKARSLRNETINTMSTVSARSFSVEETEKYAGSRGDVARMAMNYAGVAAANDQRNDIIIRGNSPSMLLWRLEDVDVPNPNHFAENGTTGGPVGMLNNNLLINSDFFTGAFPAEYGNAISGVFDLKMRTGNNERHEFLFQCGFNGFELGAEGPFSKKSKASYLANFRYSTFELMDEVINFGTSGIPKYKDLSVKLNFPLEKGNVSFFVLAGASEIAMLDSKEENAQDMFTDEGQDLYNRSQMIATGLSYSHFIGQKTWYKITLSGVCLDGGTLIDTLDSFGRPHLNVDHNFTNYNTSLSGFIHTKYNSRFSGRIGAVIDRLGFDLKSAIYEKEYDSITPLVDYRKTFKDGPTLSRMYAQGNYRLNDKLSIIPGIHFISFSLNGSSSIEPRLGVKWELNEKNKLSFGYGLHSRIQNLSTYYFGTRMPDGTLEETNNQLGLTKSHQLVVAYDKLLAPNTRLKSEIYYQHLFNVPIEIGTGSYSLLNSGAGWGIQTEDSLVNKGTGRNYGIEFTLERFFSRNLYYLATISLYESKYKGSDNIERNTDFNGNYVINLLAGKEFPVKKRAAFNLDLKVSYGGGKRYTPLNLEASILNGEAEYDYSRTNELQFDPFFKADFKIGYRLNSKNKRISQEFQFYIENFTNHKNILIESYSPSKKQVTQIYQLGIFPMANYRIHF